MKSQIRILLTVILIQLPLLAIDITRSEMERFHLLNDRQTIEKSLLKDGNHYFWSDIGVSSRLIKLIGEIQDTQSSSSETLQQTEISKLLVQNANTEKYINIGFDTLIPTIPFKFSNYIIYPMIFYRLKIGSSFSIENIDDALDPSAQVYLMQRTSMGTRFEIKQENYHNDRMGIELYRDSIKDFYETKTSNEIAEQDDIIDLNELEEQEKTIKANISYTFNKRRSRYTFEIRDLKLMSSSSSEKDSVFGSTPLLHFAFDKKLNWSNKYDFNWALGSHYRSSKYSIAKSLYTALKVDFKDVAPLNLQGKIDNQFLLVIAGTTFKYFDFYYGLKMAYRNPQDNIWTPTMHRIAFGFPF